MVVIPRNWAVSSRRKFKKDSRPGLEEYAAALFVRRNRVPLRSQIMRSGCGCWSGIGGRFDCMRY